ncbi:MAG: hypothetical protein QXZ28_04945, partial [Candidatus Methanomethylicaceae archaeon]
MKNFPTILKLLATLTRIILKIFSKGSDKKLKEKLDTMLLENTALRRIDLISTLLFIILAVAIGILSKRLGLSIEETIDLISQFLSQLETYI